MSDCCGFRSIICSFIGLAIVITAALILQLVYDSNAFQVHKVLSVYYSTFIESFKLLIS